MVARGEMDPAVVDGLFRHAKGIDPELDESTFLGNLHRAINTAEQAKAFDRAMKQRTHEEVMATVPEADRTILAAMPDEGLLAFKRIMDQRGGDSPQQRDELFRMAQVNNPDLSRARFERAPQLHHSLWCDRLRRLGDYQMHRFGQRCHISVRVLYQCRVDQLLLQRSRQFLPPLLADAQLDQGVLRQGGEQMSLRLGDK